MQTTLFGIPNCDQVKKARTWLDAHGIDHNFHDFKKSGVSREAIMIWLADNTIDVLVNRKGTTWRALSDERKAVIADQERAIDLMQELPSLIKRPVLVTGGRTYVGFSDATFQQVFKK